MKVIQLLRRFVPQEWGGSESAVYHLCKELTAHQVDSPIYATDMLSKPGKDLYEGVKIKRFPYCFPWLNLQPEEHHQLALKGGSPLSASLFLALLMEPNLSLIHTHVPLRLGGMARTASRWRGIPYLVSIHGGHHTLPQEQTDQMLKPVSGKWEWGKVFGWLLGSRRVLEDAAAIICVGRDEYELMQKRYPSKKVRYIPNGVHCAAFASASGELFRTQYQISPNEKLILCVSRLDPQKNQLLLLRAFAQFSKRHPLYRLVLIGPVSVESYYTALRAEATRLGIEHKVVWILGYTPFDPLLPSAYRAAEFFVLPSLSEPFGIVILEAWAASLPVIASRVGGIPGFAKNEKNSLLFESGHEEELVEKMCRLAENAPLRESLALQGYAEVKTYDWKAIAEQILELYREILNG